MTTQVFKASSQSMIATGQARRDHSRRFSQAPLKGLLGLLYTWQTRAEERAHLATLPDCFLNDAGLTREAAHAEASKPFWQA